MTAHDILDRYQAIAPAVGHKPSAWMLMLSLCAAGAEGISRSELGERLKSRRLSTTRTIRNWQAAELITTTSKPARGRHGGRAQVIFHATPRLYKLLSIDPT